MYKVLSRPIALNACETPSSTKRDENKTNTIKKRNIAANLWTRKDFRNQRIQMDE